MQVSGLSAHGGPVVMSGVRQVLSSNGQPISLRPNLNETSDAISYSVFPADTANRGHSGRTTNVESPDTTNSLFTGIASISTQQKPTVDVIAADDVEGTICDCGEILIAGGGFPKWPFLFLGLIPLFFLGGSGDTPPDSLPLPTPTSTPLSTPTPPVAVPEPATLLLFGSSLAAVAAFLRRRRNVDALTEKPDKVEAGAC